MGWLSNAWRALSQRLTQSRRSSRSFTPTGGALDAASSVAVFEDFSVVLDA
jgi:hypothetical protein